MFFGVSIYFLPRNDLFGFGSAYSWAGEGHFRRFHRVSGICYIILAISFFPLLNFAGMKNLLAMAAIAATGAVMLVFNRKALRLMESGGADFTFEDLALAKKKFAEYKANAAKPQKPKKGRGKKATGELAFGRKNFSIFFVLLNALLFFLAYLFAAESARVMGGSAGLNENFLKLLNFAFFAIAVLFALSCMFGGKKRLGDFLPFSLKMPGAEFAAVCAARAALLLSSAIYAFLIDRAGVSLNPEIIFTMLLGTSIAFVLPHISILKQHR